MKKLVLCFDRARRNPEPHSATNAHRLFDLLDDSDEQVAWYHPGVSMADAWTRWNPLCWRETPADDARATIAEAYQFLVDRWEPGDRIYMFGVGRGAYCAQTLTRLLAIVGVLPDLMDYVLSAYALPRTERNAHDWARVTDVASRLLQQRQIGLPVWYLGLWDTLKIPGFTRRTMPDPMPNVEHGRHAVAIDGPFGERLVSSASDRIEEVWFRGAHRDVAGGPAACGPLADITFDWVLDGALEAGLSAERDVTSAPGRVDALAETAHTVGVRRLPADAKVHSSVEVYLRRHRQYWKRLPDEVCWHDLGRAGRNERPVPAPAVDRIADVSVPDLNRAIA
ncbi:DUF2235 domain-containing protein [Mycobacterium sp. B14F4]|uniref:DUF2235 domain-containing protein n=1 Tax=Mycobacterium sp. B14F4 TaxID=3153565 RepID=UPI00325EE690